MVLTLRSDKMNIFVLSNNLKSNIMSLRIKEVLKEKKMQVSELADILGINRVSLSQQINGNPTIETLQRIADALNVHVSELFEQPSKDIINCPYCGGKIKIDKA